MKKLLVAAALVLGLGMSGVLSTANDYASIGINHVSQWFKRSIPVAVDIEVLDLSIKKLDAEIATNGRAVVQESVALDRQVKEVKEKAQGIAQLKSDLSGLRDKFVSTECDATKSSLESAMSKRLTRVKAQSQTLEAMQIDLERKRESYEKMVTAFEKQKSDRDVLREKLELIRAEYASMKIRGDLEQSALANSASRKASDLAIEIADRLEVQRRLALQRSDDSDLESLTIKTTTQFDVAELDEFLGSRDRLVSRN